MDRNPLIRRLALKNLLSFGPNATWTDLLPLNVLIGPNASGKSNVLEALGLLRATSTDLAGSIREGGGVGEYIWKGARSTQAVIWSEVECPTSRTGRPVSHGVMLDHQAGRFAIGDEQIITSEADEPHAPLFLYFYRGLEGKPFLRSHMRSTLGEAFNFPLIPLNPTDLKPDQSILSQRRDPALYPELTYLAEQFARIALFQEWNFGRRSPARLPQPTDLPNDFLLPDASNLGLILHDLGQTSAKRDELVDYLRRFYARAGYISTKIQGGTLQLYIEEEGGRLIPATRLSDGTLRYLCLLAILLHPNPPPVIGIEEPELGLHPDILPTIAELLRKPLERTQLFVTTHSDTLVSALTDTPECILVSESTPEGTTIKRLEADPLREWLEKYSLGEIWRMGEIGGNRW
jgi:predicted ATPase